MRPRLERLDNQVEGFPCVVEDVGSGKKCKSDEENRDFVKRSILTEKEIKDHREDSDASRDRHDDQKVVPKGGRFSK